jgi:hypothetical protein
MGGRGLGSYTLLEHIASYGYILYPANEWCTCGASIRLYPLVQNLTRMHHSTMMLDIRGLFCNVISFGNP